jgi:pimeloyl-ACP methyl ester carboxylesterase
MTDKKRRRRAIAYALAGMVASGIVYHNVRMAIDARRYPPPGTLVDVGGYRLHLYCEGSGTGTVILDAGAGTWSFMMGRLQRQLRDDVRVCAYDRAGLGWSDAGNLFPDVGASVEDLRRLVEVASLSKPLVLVGHLFGANVAQAILDASATRMIADEVRRLARSTAPVEKP